MPTASTTRIDGTERSGLPEGGGPGAVRRPPGEREWPERSARSKRRRPRRPRGTYVKHAILHPYNLPLLVLAVATGLISGSTAILAVSLAAELLILGIVPRLDGFRAHIDELLEQAERLEAAKARAALLLQMDDLHRQELERLEHIVDRTKDNVRRHGVAAAELLLDDCLGLTRLTACYVRLAIAYKASKDLLASTNRQVLAEKIRALSDLERGETGGEATGASVASERVRRLASRRLSIACKRAGRWDRTQEDLEAIAHQLATIGELIHLVHEQSVSPLEAQGMSDEIDRFVRDLEDNEGTLRELSELSSEGGVDQVVLELGRTPSHP